MNKSIKILSFIGKALGLITGLSAYTDAIPAKWGPVGLIAFGVASILKDAVNRLADLLDDGKVNDSIKVK